jgi:hypothetical protein
MLREDVDAVEDALLEADPRPSVQAWLAERRKLQSRVGGHQRRLYSVFMYCDDNIIIVVGLRRAIRLLRAWRSLTGRVGLIMAIPEKRSLGVWGVWVGALIFAGLGIIVIPRQKILRCSEAITRLLRHGIEFEHYRSLVGLLEHVRCVAVLPRRYMHGLYAPHGADGEGRGGPQAMVRCTQFMEAQLIKWLDVLSCRCGCAVTDVLKMADLARERVLLFVTSSDAATDSEPPGMGGFMNGYWWHFPIPEEALDWLHITSLGRRVNRNARRPPPPPMPATHHRPAHPGACRPSQRAHQELAHGQSPAQTLDHIFLARPTLATHHRPAHPGACRPSQRAHQELAHGQSPAQAVGPSRVQLTSIIPIRLSPIPAAPRRGEQF